jgi:hypothetical protein
MVVTHVPVPEQPPPLHPEKSESPPGDAVRVTEVPLIKDAEQVPPQLMPLGELVTVPLPVPAFVTVSVYVFGANVAVTVQLAVTSPVV